MKKNILIFCTVLAAFALTAFGYMNWSHTATTQEETSCSKAVAFDFDFLYDFNEKDDPDLFYNVESRFMTTITKEDLQNAKSIIDILPEKATQSVESYQNARISVLYGDKEITEIGNGDVLNSAQIKLLQSIDYSANIRVTSMCKRKIAFTGGLEKDSIVYYMTIVPEKEAVFSSGHDALIKYLKENSKDKTAIIKEDKLQPGKVSFTVTKNGKIANVKLTSTSGYPSVDEALVELITNMPEKWEPATNSNGDKIDQELVFFFGLEGC